MLYKYTYETVQKWPNGCNMLMNKETGLSSLTNHPLFLVIEGGGERERENESERKWERERERTCYLFIKSSYIFSIERIMYYTCISISFSKSISIFNWLLKFTIYMYALLSIITLNFTLSTLNRSRNSWNAVNVATCNQCLQVTGST